MEKQQWYVPEALDRAYQELCTLFRRKGEERYQPADFRYDPRDDPEVLQCAMELYRGHQKALSNGNFGNPELLHRQTLLERIFGFGVPEFIIELTKPTPLYSRGLNQRSGEAFPMRSME